MPCDPTAPTVTATDNCGTVTVVAAPEQNNVVGGCGTIVRSWTATDQCGNSTTHTQTITVDDNTAPVFTNAPADVAVDCNAIPTAPTVTATDNCGTVTVVAAPEQNNVVGGCGTIVRSWTATDQCGNSTTHTQTITVDDNTAPVFTNAPADVTVDCNAIPTAPTVTATDNCGTVTVVAAPEQNNVVGGCGTIVRSWTATDQCGNSTTHTQTITVDDNTAPVFTNAPARCNC